jgi:hypothetical protein
MVGPFNGWTTTPPGRATAGPISGKARSCHGWTTIRLGLLPARPDHVMVGLPPHGWAVVWPDYATPRLRRETSALLLRRCCGARGGCRAARGERAAVAALLRRVWQKAKAQKHRENVCLVVGGGGVLQARCSFAMRMIMAEARRGCGSLLLLFVLSFLCIRWRQIGGYIL